MKLSLILEAVDRMTAPARKAAGGVKSITDAAKPAIKAVAGLDRQVKQAGASSAKFGALARSAAGRVDDLGNAADPAARSISTMDRQITRVSASTLKWTRLALRSAAAIDRTTSRVMALGRAAALSVSWVGLKSLEVSAKAAGNAAAFAARQMKNLVVLSARWGGIGIAAGAGWLTAGMVGRSASWETLAVELERIEGSADKAKAGLDWVRKLSWDTAAPLDDLANAFVTARKAGLDPMSGSFQSLLDKAVESKKGLDEIVATVKEAKNLDFGGLEALGIGTERKKGMVTFSWLEKGGKRAVRTVRENGRQIERALSDIFEVQSGGAAQAQARTLAGMWQRFKNMVATFQLDVGDAGIFDFLKVKVQNLLDWVSAKAKDGSLERWAREVSDQLKSAFLWAEKLANDVNWRAIADVVAEVASAAGNIAEAILKAVSALKEWQYQRARGVLENGLNGWFTTDYQRGRIRQQIGALDAEYGRKAAPPKGKVADAQTLRSGVRGERTGKLDARGWTGALSERPKLAPPVTRPATRAPMKPAPQAAPKGKITLDIRTQPGTTARPTKLAATGMDIEVNTGRAMGAIA
jgi:phage tail tape-measure protein